MIKPKINWDSMGIAASLACAIHCAILPLLLTSLPIFGINIINNMAFEFLMILLAFFVGSFSLYHGYRKHHGRFLPLILFSAGMVFLLVKQAWHEQEWLWLPFAVLFIVSAHLVNFRLGKMDLSKTPKEIKTTAL